MSGQYRLKEIRIIRALLSRMELLFDVNSVD